MRIDVIVTYLTHDPIIIGANPLSAFKFIKGYSLIGKAYCS